MKEIIIIGPIPPPIHGESVALKQIIESKNFKSKYKLKVINTNRAVIHQVGKFSFRKILQDVIIIIKTFLNLINRKKHALYVSISQTKLGLFRDLILIQLGNQFASKTIIHLHGNNLGNILDSLSPFQMKFVKKVLGKVTTGIVLGEKLKSNYRGLVRNVQIVANGVDLNFISDKDIDEAKSLKTNSKINIVYLSNLMKEKGYIELVKAVTELIDEGYSINLTLAGAIHDEKDYFVMKKFIEKHGFDNSIRYIGIVTNLKKKKLLLDSDLMILPSNYAVEGQPISIIEGMAAGLPIISTQRGCIEDLINSNGILLEEGSSTLIKESIVSIINDPEKMNLYSQASRQHYLTNFSDKKYIDNIIKAIEEK
ncbi:MULTISPECIES: glycosyltransferase family 4 protein [Bacillus]|uniref:Glycosyl transferase family 1 domain-containing protein n=2 Tax=Bacillus TaxID=1386 RepID=A0A0M4FYX6_9BACI|nr:MULTISPECIES: glycosyltransferase family 4 protein [Bacillus]ALC82638.1 hypothetical protein AM592_14425 [Bacillus gobiensis]MBP1081578.1 glycosyltransferase involved in cell wall biosynthesis [Bacillus capparidis]MED1096239.1 glycosyltransferase family 4 protein [Bacillus capparidis]